MDFRIFAAVMSVAVVGSAFGGFSKEKFRNPENIYSPAYFWMWNAKLDAAQLNAQVDGFPPTETKRDERRLWKWPPLIGTRK